MEISFFLNEMSILKKSFIESRETEDKRFLCELLAKYLILSARFHLKEKWVNANHKVVEEKLNKLSALEILGLYRIKHVSAHLTQYIYDLENIQKRKSFTHFPIHIIHTIASSELMLRYQSQGIRIVSVLFKPKELLEPILHFSNAYELFIHDLHHARKFMERDYFHLGQVGFYKICLKIQQKNIFNFDFNKEEFLHLKEKWEYLISDMNTHPVHLLKTLKDFVYKYSKLKKINPSQVEQHLFCAGEFSEEMIALYEKLNTLKFHSIDDALKLTHYLECYH